MSIKLPDWFIPKYKEEVTIRAQQRTRRLAGTTTESGMFIGDDVFFPRFGSVETYKSDRLAALALANAKMDFVKAHAEPEFVAFGIWDPDKKKLNINAAQYFADASVKAINRAHDRQVIDALQAAKANGVSNTKGDPAEAIEVIGDYATIADLDKIAEAIVALGTDEMFEGETITVATPFKLQVQNALDPYIAKTDVKGNRPWDNIRWVQYERLSGNGPLGEGWLKDPKTKVATGATGVDMFIWAKSAVASAANDEDVPIDERLGSQLADMMGQWFQATALVLEPAGVKCIKSKLDFSLQRKATPVEAIA